MVEPSKKTTASKSLQTVKEVRGFLRTMYQGGHEAKQRGEKVAWIMVGTNIPILRAMNVYPIFPENYTAFCAAKRAQEPFLERAEEEGYSHNICGYARLGLGFASLKNELGRIPDFAPEGGMADPDMLISGTYNCDTRYKWFQAFNRYMNTPLFLHDSLLYQGGWHQQFLPFPPMDVDPVGTREAYLRFEIDNLKLLIEFLEQHTGQKLDLDRLDEIERHYHAVHSTWWEVFEMRRAIPCPIPTGDSLAAQVPYFFMPWEPAALDFYHRLAAEVRQRVEQGVGVVPEERFRLIFGKGLPPWHSLFIFNMFEQHGAVTVFDLCYWPGPPQEVEEPDPLRRMALKGWERWRVYHERAQGGCGDPSLQVLLDAIKDYQAEGVIYHLPRSCRFTMLGTMFEGRVVQEQTGVPSLYLESDIIDIRDFSEGQMRTQIESFMEMLETRKLMTGG
ncbi:2-hydroxyacyl-CoA dehydratase subunit D [Thermodesulfobacteriota bacterium]